MIAPVRRAAHCALPFVLAGFAAAPLSAQMQAPPNHWDNTQVDSGQQPNTQPIEGVVWSQFVMLPQGTPWLRLHFANTNLDKGSYLRMTALLDGSTMTMHQEHLAQWQSMSCFFNGGTVLVELVAGPGTVANRVAIDKIMVGEHGAVAPETICGSTDDRVPSSDPRAGRIDPIGCTGWIIDVPATGIDKVHLSAGHCNGTGQVLQFAVPSSLSNCSLVFPPPAKQFAIDTATSQFVNGGVGNDYWVFRCFPNSTTGLTTFQEQGAAFTLAATIPGTGTTLRNYGYGLDGTSTNGASGGNSSCSCSAASGTGTRNQTQQTHTGPLVAVTTGRLDYSIDTCGGNSGSPVIDNGTGLAVAIHTHGGCTTTAGSTNSGTNVTLAGLQAAIAAVAPPAVPNDACAGAIEVGLGVNGPFSNVGASLSTNAWTCGGTSTGSDVWFRFDAGCGGDYTFDTCTATRTFDTVLQVFQGGCLAPTLLACNDDACSLGSRLTLTLGAGAYLIRVGGYNQAAGQFDLVVSRAENYDAGPIVTAATGGAGGAPVSMVQTSLGLTVLGYSANGSFSLADDFATHGAWCVEAIELFCYQTTTTSPSITGVWLEIYNGDPSAGGVPIVGSPGFANNLMATPGYTVVNTMANVYRALESTPTDATRPVQSVLVTLANPVTLNSALVPGGRYFLRWTFTGSGVSGPFVPPITVWNSATTGNALQSTSTGTWSGIVSGTAPQGLPFALYGSSPAQPGSLTNLGGGCSAASLEVHGAPHVGGLVQVDLVNGNPAAVPLVLLGFTDPNASLAPFCGCVQHATLDVVSVGTSYNWQIPMVPAAVGFELFVQGDQLFSPALACDIGIGFRFELTDGWRIRLW